MQRATCNVAEAAAVLGISTATAYRNIQSFNHLVEGVRALRTRGRYVAPIIDLENLLGPLPWLRQPATGGQLHEDQNGSSSSSSIPSH
jgi:hypothetical protein